LKYLLDTNTCIYFINKRSEMLIKRLNSIKREDISVCSVVKAELIYGATKSANPQKNLKTLNDFLRPFHSFAFDDKSAQVYGKTRAELEKNGTPIGPNDLCIASIAMANNLTLITNNLKEFEIINGLKLEDWSV